MAKEIEITNELKEKAENQILDLMKNYDYDTVEYPIEVLVEQYENGLDGDQGEIFVPDYQREFTWDDKRKSKFIESIILGIPIPYIFFADVDGRFEIVDGSQRIRTLHSFLRNEFSLKDLEKLNLLNGFYFKDLNIIRQRRINKRSLKMIALGEKTDPQARFDLFERINTGSDILKVMEVRKGLFKGDFYDFLKECAQNELFKKLCPISDKRTNREEPQELMLRYFAYSNNLENYTNNVAKFADDYMKEIDSKFDNNMKMKFEGEFLRMLNFVDGNFELGFAKSKNATTTPRVRFDAISVGVTLALRENPSIKQIKTEWLESDEFKKHTRSDAANNKRNLLGRINYVKSQVLAGL